MRIPLSLFITAGCFICLMYQRVLADGECRKSDTNTRELRLSIKRRLDERDGHWMSNFSAWRVDPESQPRDITLDAKHKTTVCDGKLVTHIEAIVKEVNSDRENVTSISSEEKILFHPKHGHNAVILDNGRSVQKLDLEDVHNAIVFTSRPLKNRELFEVRLEKRTSKSNHCFGIGVMNEKPENVEIPKAMYTYSNITWMYHNNGIYQNSKSILSNYGRNIDSLQVRERVGVMRNDDGELHFFVNGVDQGRAASNVPEDVYGVFELWYDAVKGTIVY